jgi:hypothetical protein
MTTHKDDDDRPVNHSLGSALSYLGRYLLEKWRNRR